MLKDQGHIKEIMNGESKGTKENAEFMDAIKIIVPVCVKIPRKLKCNKIFTGREIIIRIGETKMMFIGREITILVGEATVIFIGKEIII